MRPFLIPLLLSVTALSGLAACQSPTGGDQDATPLAVSGKGLADRYCSECHAVGVSDKSKLADAPPFRELRARYSREDMDTLLRVRMVDIHPRMPVLNLDQGELSAFLDYWQSLPSPRT